MKFYVKSLGFVLIIVFSFFIFSSVNADTDGLTTGTNSTTGGLGTGQGDVTTGLSTGNNPKPATSSFSLTIKNPLKADSLQCLLYDIVNGVVGIMAIVAALYIIYSGFLFIAAQGNPAELTKAKTAFFNAVIGTAILLGAWAITAFVVNVISSVVEDPSKLPDVSSISC